MFNSYLARIIPQSAVDFMHWFFCSMSGVIICYSICKRTPHPFPAQGIQFSFCNYIFYVLVPMVWPVGSESEAFRLYPHVAVTCVLPLLGFFEITELPPEEISGLHLLLTVSHLFCSYGYWATIGSLGAPRVKPITSINFSVGSPQVQKYWPLVALCNIAEILTNPLTNVINGAPFQKFTSLCFLDTPKFCNKI